MNDIWCIEARAFRIPHTPFSHNFWALVGPEGMITEQIHGLAVDQATGAAQAVGNSSHLLQAVCAADILWSVQLDQPKVVCVSDVKEAVDRHWQAAVNAIPAINALRLPYPDLWQHAYRANSNTIFNTIGQIMGFAPAVSRLPTWAPGITRIISREIIEQYRYNPGCPSS